MIKIVINGISLGANDNVHSPVAEILCSGNV